MFKNIFSAILKGILYKTTGLLYQNIVYDVLLTFETEWDIKEILGQIFFFLVTDFLKICFPHYSLKFILYINIGFTVSISLMSNFLSFWMSFLVSLFSREYFSIFPPFSTFFIQAQL